MAHYRDSGPGPSTSAGPSMLVAAYHAEQQPIPLAPRPYPDGTAPVFRACASAMQQPTLTHVRIRSTRDANQIFYAVARNLLPMTVRRLDAEERRAIVSGNVYVWEERGSSTEATGLGIERWTDGMRWSPSRVRDEFLFYHQKEVDPDEAADLPPTRYARVMRPKASSSDGSLSDTSPQEPVPAQRPGAASDPERLIKQTYSVIVALPDDIRRGLLRKWHLTAYFTQASVDSLKTVDEMLPGGSRVPVPDGWFSSARTGKARRDTTRQKQYAFARTLGVEVSARVPPTIMESGPPSVGVGADAGSGPSRNLNLNMGENGPGSGAEERMRVDSMDSSNPNAGARPPPPSYNANRPPAPPLPPAGPSVHNPGMGYEYGREYDYDYARAHGHGLGHGQHGRGHEYDYEFERSRMTALSYPALPPHERMGPSSGMMQQQQEWGPAPRVSTRQGYGRLPPSISISTSASASNPSTASTSTLPPPPLSTTSTASTSAMTATGPSPALVAPISYHTSPSRLASPPSQRERERPTAAVAAVHPYAAAYATHVSSRAGSPRVGSGGAGPSVGMPLSASAPGAMYSRGSMPVSMRALDAAGSRSQGVLPLLSLSLPQEKRGLGGKDLEGDVDVDVEMDVDRDVDMNMGGDADMGEEAMRESEGDVSEKAKVKIGEDGNENTCRKGGEGEGEEGGDISVPVPATTSTSATITGPTITTNTNTNAMTMVTKGFALPDTPESTPPALGVSVSLPPALPLPAMPSMSGDAKVGLGIGIGIGGTSGSVYRYPNSHSGSGSSINLNAQGETAQPPSGPSAPISTSGPATIASTTTATATTVGPTNSTTPQTSPMGQSRALIPLDDLGTAMFPRRDPADDALLRRFRGLRTTPPAQGAE